MTTTISKYEFIQIFDKSEFKNKYSAKGLVSLFNYFERIEEELSEQINLDIIDIVCNITEFASIEELKENYNINSNDIEDVKKELENYTNIILCENDCIIIYNF